MKPEKTGFSSLRWPQEPKEVDRFLAVLIRRGVRSYLEIGTRYGDTMHYIGSRLPAGSRVVGVELPSTRKDAKRVRERATRAVADLRKQGQAAEIIFGDSHAKETIETVAKYGPFDAVFIDGDHSLEGVTADWQHYGSKARILTAFHDISSLDSVASFFSRFNRGGETLQIKHNPSIFGIGIVFL